MRSHNRRRRAGVAALGLLLVLGACSSDGGTGEVASDTSASDGAGTTVAAPVEPVPSPGCGASTATAGVEQERTLVVNDTPRRYLLTTPSGHDGATPLPVVLDFHGLMEGAAIHSQMSQWSALAEEEDVVAVFPEGTGQPVRWNADGAAEANDDLVYVDTMLAQIGDELCVDESRVYATGLSYGAIFTSLLLCHRADVLAAAAPVSGIDDPADCEPARPVPIVAFHGTDDPILQFNGGVDLTAIPGLAPEGATTTSRPPAELDGEGYPATVATWAERNGCEPEPTDTEVTAEVLHRVYDCPQGADVEFYIIIGGGHSWPSSEFSQSIGAIVGPTTFDIDATRDAWEFLEQFTNA